MSSPAALPALPLAVLVLAWDETMPAVRALVEATHAPAPALDALLVMVPQAEAPGTLSAEEYLPLPAPAPAAETTPEAEPAPPEVVFLPSAPALPALPLAATLPPLLPPGSQPAVRVLHLSSYTLPELAQRAGQPLPAPTWTGPATAPAAPYQGATSPLPMAAAQPPAPVADRVAAPAAALPPPPAYEPAEPLALAPDAEADWPLALVAAELERFELGELGEPSLAEPDAEPPALPPPAEPDDWSAALAALRQPVALPTAEAPSPAVREAAAAPLHAPYDAPNLNFQVIQYARFAVPVALAEAPYAVIYAPAWPTWLAAQELRLRTGRPLVLHVAALAASADEPLDLAAGWMAELQRQALRRADVILTETHALAQRLCHELGLPGTCVHTVPAADATAVAQALHAARPRPAAGPA